MNLSSEGSSAAGRQRWLRLLRAAYLGGLAIVLAYVVWTRRTALADLLDTARPGWLLAALALAVGQVLPSVVLWSEALRSLGEDVRVRTVLSATARSLPARYLPGSVWYALGRAALLRREQGLRRSALGTVAVIETLLVIVAAIGMGFALMGVTGRLPTRPWWLIGWFVALGVGASPPAVNAALRWFAGRRGTEPVRLSWPAWGRLLVATAVHWTWSAATFVVYLRAFPEVPAGRPLEIAGAFLVAWAIGFLAVFAPQGLGIFEAAVATLLVDGDTASVAVIAGGYRALVAVRDAFLFLAATARRGRGRLARRNRPEGS